jgi:hypothetical protein
MNYSFARVQASVIGFRPRPNRMRFALELAASPQMGGLYEMPRNQTRYSQS